MTNQAQMTKYETGIAPSLSGHPAFADLAQLRAAVKSRGFIESDGATHFIFARHAFEQPIYFVDIWGRPLCTSLFSVPARLGGLISGEVHQHVGGDRVRDYRGGNRAKGRGFDIRYWR